jgi:hypothetical protein
MGLTTSVYSIYTLIFILLSKPVRCGFASASNLGDTHCRDLLYFDTIDYVHGMGNTPMHTLH